MYFIMILVVKTFASYDANFESFSDRNVFPKGCIKKIERYYCVIKIVNDFFDKENFEKIKYHCTIKLYFEPQYFSDATERNKKTYYGDRYDLKNDPELFKQFTDTIEKNLE